MCRFGMVMESSALQDSDAGNNQVYFYCCMSHNSKSIRCNIYLHLDLHHTESHTLTLQTRSFGQSRNRSSTTSRQNLSQFRLPLSTVVEAIRIASAKEEVRGNRIGTLLPTSPLPLRHHAGCISERNHSTLSFSIVALQRHGRSVKYH